MKGKLIAIEGIDGAGKSTLARFLKEELERRGFPVFLSAEPTKGRYGKVLRKLIKKGEVSLKEEYKLFLQDRRNHVKYKILPALKKGKIVLLDRYYLSNAAYQGCRGINPEKIIKENEEFAPKPDFVIYLDIHPDKALRRKRKKEAFFEEKEFLKKVRTYYLKFLRRFPHVIISASRTKEEVQEIALRELLRFLHAD